MVSIKIQVYASEIELFLFVIVNLSSRYLAALPLIFVATFNIMKFDITLLQSNAQNKNQSPIEG